jgi:hypothetical protein
MFFCNIMLVIEYKSHCKGMYLFIINNPDRI